MRGYPRLFTKSLIVCGMLLIISIAVGLGLGRERGLELVSVESGSMAPMIQKGDAVVIDRRADDFTVGLVVSYQSPKDARTSVTHRIISVDRVRGTVLTKGDNLMTPDPPVAMSALQGTVKYRISHAGQVMDFIRKPLGLAVLVYVPAAGIIASELLRLQRYYSGSGAGRYLLHGY